MVTSPEEYWDRSAPGWKQHIRNRPEAELYRKYILHPMIFHLMGDVTGKNILDAGCGEGYLSRMIADLGAAKVTGIDISGKMLETAREEEAKNPKNITYHKASLTDLSGISGEFDLVLANLVINIIEDYKKIFEQLARPLKEQGLLIISIPHPCFDGVDAGMVKMTDNEIRWSANRYIDEVSGYAIHGAPTFHRPLSAYINAAFNIGFVLTGFIEPVTPKEYSELFPAYTRQFDRIPSLAGMRFRKELKSE